MSRTNRLTETRKAAAQKVLISTLHPLGGNYGGTMQAYALQRTIREMGFVATTINSSWRPESSPYIARRIRYAIRKYLKLSPNPAPVRQVVDAEDLQQLTKPFVTTNIQTVDLFGVSRRERNRILSETSVIVVGSDQVWRGGYADVPTQLLNYARKYSLLRISYAASFGADQLIEYSRKTLAESRSLVQLFDRISVREASGVQICKEAWGVDAEQHIDPALLLEAEDYSYLCQRDKGTLCGAHGRLLTYILDWNPENERISEDLSRNLGLQAFHFLPNQSADLSTTKKSRPQRMKSVEEWLRNFESAEFILTDSFHGTVFAIIFRKPFIAIGNKSRGRARFESLLAQLGLQSRLVDSASKPTSYDLTIPDWEAVEARLQVEKKKSMSYLQEALGASARK
ncbi:MULTISPECIES: polysaccharide pyruvyl transferase family protein [unclassified Dietzia]|uniref:polysaccharide pyruvyl transferase family protein n=1 Tax=unclassified Dietzia TaxID=2617939 RepID=UPI0015FE4BB6|nr:MULTISPECIES: polysaccharide pyruvyl transferase family protein [unclassified Dietzia]MBB1039786.1 polysaccharide pyruvyl transferase family protein [Dietzia sp. Cai40]MBB1043936.1 polysaccharide pyruvyl transferase family protein [Dietzia sp. DQ11-44]